MTTDALLVVDEAGDVQELPWPEAEFIIGNPPFLGGKFLRRELGDDYVNTMFSVYNKKVPREADLVTYWFERARAQIASNRSQRAGLLATQGIRGGANRKVLDNIKASGDIFMAWPDEAWIVEGAMVHVSIVGFDNGEEPLRRIRGQAVASINSNLTSGIDLTKALPLRSNLGISFMGDTKGGPFDIRSELANDWLVQPNPHGRPNSDVVRPWVNGKDITGRPRGMWIVDYPPGTSMEEAALYEAPFEFIKEHVRPARESSKTTIDEWWLHERPRIDMRQALYGLSRYIATTRVSKHRLFVWLPVRTLADSATIVIAREDDFTFGVLHSRIHELWARGTGTQLREVQSGFRYTPRTTFEKFPFPETAEAQEKRVEVTAAELHERREHWLNPPDIMPASLEARTLTNLYNAPPTWLEQLHQKLDAAVAAAYGWPTDLRDDEILERLLALNLDRASEERHS